jgi:hypothetical protein
LRAVFGDGLPLGWILETENGDAIGCVGTAWSQYAFRGQSLIAAVARGWFVRAEYRGFALQLLDEYFNQHDVDLYINTAVSLPAHPAFSSYCAPVPVGRWDCMLYWPIAHDADPAPRTGAFTTESVDEFDDRFDLFWGDLVRENPAKLLANRSAAALSWHFGSPMRKKRLRILTASRNGRMRAYCTLTRQDHAFRLPALTHNDPSRISAMRLADYQSIEPEIDYLSGFIDLALRLCAKEGVNVLEQLGRDLPKMRAVDESAPECAQLENWKFYYSASDPALEATLRDPSYWDPSAYDGDASFE